MASGGAPGESRDGAVFLVRAWHDGDRFVARITQTVDVHRPVATDTVVVDGPEDLRLRFDRWLAEVTDP